MTAQISIITLPSGEEIEAQVDSTWTDDIIRQKLIDKGIIEPEKPSALKAGAKSFGARFLDNLLEVPQQAFGQLVSGGGVPDSRDRAGGQPGDVAGGQLPSADTKDIFAGLQAMLGRTGGAGAARRGQERMQRAAPAAQRQADIDNAPVGSVGAPGGFNPPPAAPGRGPSMLDDFRRLQAGQQVSELEAREANPLATSVGRGLGDVATVFAGKRPLVSAARRSGSRIPHRAAEEVIKDMAPGVARAAREASHGIAKRLAPLVKRMAETGAEGAALAALDDQDIGTGAAAGAGLEAAAAPFRVLGKFATTKPAQAMMVGIVAAMVIPGGRERILNTIEDMGDDVAVAIALGVPATIAAHRFAKKGTLARNLPDVADLVSILPRGSLTQVITDFVEAPDVVGPLVQNFVDNPTDFGAFQEAFESALAGDGSVGQVAREILADPKMRHLFGKGNAPTP